MLLIGNVINTHLNTIQNSLDLIFFLRKMKKTKRNGNEKTKTSSIEIQIGHMCIRYNTTILGNEYASES